MQQTTMLIKPETNSSSSTGPTTCGNCGVEERRLLHHIRHRGIFRRLCTTCVLRLHPQSFCPTCFTIYHPTPPPPNDAVTCFKCYSSSHSHCVGPNYPNPYICPNCINPNSPIFTLQKAKAKDFGMQGEEEYRVIDRDSARVLLAAARIAAVSMSKAAVAARIEAERRAKEAAFTRKRAREALEHLAYLVAKEKLKKKEVVAAVGTTVVRNMKRMNGGNNNDVVAALNAVELREGVKTGELSKVDSSNNDNNNNNVVDSSDIVGMDVEEGNSGNVDRNLGNGDAVVISNEDQVQPMNGSGP